MSAAEVAPCDRVREVSQVGEILLAWRITPNALMLLGWQAERPTTEGMASLQRPTEQPGRFTSFAWPAAPASASAFSFLAAVQLSHSDIQGGDTLRMAGRRGNHDGVLAQLPTSFLDPVSFAAALSRAAPGVAATGVAQFLMERFAPATTAANPAIRIMVGAFLEQASTLDGCVEMLGAIPDHYAVLQGWGLPVQGGCDVILRGTAFRRYLAREACFARSDILAPSLGQALLLPAEAADAGVVDCVYLLARGGIRRRPVLVERRMLSEAEIAGHFRDILPEIRCDAATRAMLITASRPRYEGRLTLYERGYPVRLTVDLAFSAEAGCYLTGWLYDPLRIVASVSFRSVAGANLRLDEGWTRIPRPDVTEGFAGDPALPACEPDRHGHGFAVRVSCPSPGEDGLFLEVTMQDGWCGFVPLAPAAMKNEAAYTRLLASVDLHKPSGMAVIERQLAPFFAQVAARPTLLTSAFLATAWPRLIVVPLSATEPPRALLSQLLQDPLDEDEGILFVCGQDWSDASIATLERLSGFYGARAVVARVIGCATVQAALAVAADQVAANQVLLLGAETIGSASGWRRALQGVLQERDDLACMSPTVLYEDHSIRFGGCGGIEPLNAPPYIRMRRRLAGLPVGFAPTGPAVRADGVSALCCLMPRAVLVALQEQHVSAAALAWEPELDLLLRLRRSGVACWWTPAVQVYAPDTLHTSEFPERVSRLVGRWCVRAHLTGEEG